MLALDEHWLAGFFDGEGFVGILLNTRSSSPYGFRWLPWINISQKDSHILQQIKDFIGTGFVTSKRGKRGCPQYILNNKMGLRKFLDIVLPHSMVKSKELSLLDEALHLQRGSGYPNTRETALRILDIIDELRALKIRRRATQVDTQTLRARIVSSGLSRNYLTKAKQLVH